jgi:hypothetical protein
VGKDKNGKEQAVLLLDTEGIGKDYQWNETNQWIALSGQTVLARSPITFDWTFIIDREKSAE